MNRSFWVVALVALIGALVGHLIGQALRWPPLMSAVNLGFPPQPLDLLVIKLTLGLQLYVSLGAAIGMAIALFLILRK